MIELRNFSIGYDNRELLKDVNIDVKKGTLTALIGRNGSGKSTLLRALAGLNKHYSGDITVNKLSLRSITPQSLARIIAFVTTERTRIANLTCESVVAMGRAPYTNWIGRLQDIDRLIVAKALDAVGMSDYADRTMNRMSDGECQRIMIARALAQSTPVILLDEPTSFLDIPNRHELCSLLSRLAHDEKKCIIFSTHELEIALSKADNIAIIDSPELILNSAENIMKNRVIEKVFGFRPV